MNHQADFSEAVLQLQWALHRTSNEVLYQHDGIKQIAVLTRMYGDAGLDIKHGANKPSPLEQWAMNSSPAIAVAKTTENFTHLRVTPAIAETEPVDVPLTMFAGGISYVEDGWRNGWLVDHLKEADPEVAPYVTPFAAPVDRSTVGVTL